MIIGKAIVVLESHPHPYGMRLGFEGLSPALKNMPPACFSPRLRRGRAFESARSIKKSRYPNGYLDFLVRRKGLEPLTY